ncbi:MAG: hypothetical protein QW689_07175 [Nitrososphaerota archaeon]
MKLEDELKNHATEVKRSKAATVYGPGASIYVLAMSVLEGARELLPVSAVLDGEYGLKDVAVDVPARIG